MAKSEHTPGEWRVACESGDWFVTDNDYNQLPAIEANANLIAAAPDLLAALERQLDEHKRTWLTARAEVEGEGVSACLFEAEPATIAARAAIKKARGGT